MTIGSLFSFYQRTFSFISTPVPIVVIRHWFCRMSSGAAAIVTSHRKLWQALSHAFSRQALTKLCLCCGLVVRPRSFVWRWNGAMGGPRIHLLRRLHDSNVIWPNLTHRNWTVVFVNLAHKSTAAQMKCFSHFLTCSPCQFTWDISVTDNGKRQWNDCLFCNRI